MMFEQGFNQNKARYFSYTKLANVYKFEKNFMYGTYNRSVAQIRKNPNAIVPVKTGRSIIG